MSLQEEGWHVKRCRELSLNPEQHRFRSLVLHADVCQCGLAKSAEVHQRYEQAAQPYRQAKQPSYHRPAGHVYVGNPTGPDFNWNGWSEVGSTADSSQLSQTFKPDGDWNKVAEEIRKAFEVSTQTGVHLAARKNGKTTEINRAITEVNSMIASASNPADMRKAALSLATLAEEIEAFDALEPQGEEPVITWKHRFSEEGPEYTYVAVKLADRWYVTGDRSRGAYEWRQFMDLDFMQPVVKGDFLICTQWTQAS